MSVPGIDVTGGAVPGSDRILTDDALVFVADLQRRFKPLREDLLQRRHERDKAIRAGAQRLGFLPETAEIRDADWSVAPAPADLDDRRVEITGPAEPKMMINALNSGARVFMADLEDALSPTWANVVGGQAALADAVRRTLTFESPEGKTYRLGERLATLLVRPRGWHLVESHVLVDDKPMSASLFDAGLYLFHNAAERLRRGTGPYFYLAKLESHHEARLWNEVFVHAQEALGIPRGSIRATVLIETIHAAFEMDEILVRAARARGRAERGPLGLPVQLHQDVQPRAGPRPAGSRPADDDRPVHARLHRSARADVPPPPRARHRRHGRVHPEPPRPGGQRRGHRQGARRQGARERRRLRRHVGRASGPGPRRDRGVRRGAGRRAEPEAPPARGGRRDRRAAPRPARRGRPGHRGRPARERPGCARVPRLVAARQRRGRDRQPDGGRRDRRDRPLAAVAVARARHRARRRARGRRRACTSRSGTRSWPGSAAPARVAWPRQPRCSTRSS